MLMRLRRRGPHQASLTIKLPVSAPFRAYVDAEANRLRRSVIPIIGTDPRNRPVLIGSGVLLALRDSRFLVSADHVFSDPTPLSVFAADGWSRRLHGPFRSREADDLAVMRLPPELVEALSDRPFLPATALGPVCSPGEPFYASVVGYPASASKLRTTNTLDTPMEVFSHFGTDRGDGCVEVVFDHREGGHGTGGHVMARKPFGKSGGGIFGLPVRDGGVRLGEPAKLVGISTLWKRAQKRIFGASVTQLWPMLDELSGAAGTER